MSEEKKVILDTSDEAAFQADLIINGNPIKVWCSYDSSKKKAVRVFPGDETGEKLARYNGCTHRLCTCGKPVEKSYTACYECREKMARERFKKKERKVWDGKTPLYSNAYDEYFCNLDGEIEQFMVDRDIQNFDDLELMICEPNFANKMSYDWFSDLYPEDVDSLPELEKLVDEFNEKAEKLGPISWDPGYVAAIIPDDILKIMQDYLKGLREENE